MKRVSFYIVLMLCVSLTACIKNDPITYTDAVAEFDATTWNANATGVTYPLMTRVPIYNASTPTSAYTIHRTSGTILLRVNLVGPTSKTERTVGVQVFDVPFTSVTFPATASGQTPARSGGALSVPGAAMAGTHYTALASKVTIPADSTWGYLPVAILDAGATAGQARTLGIRLDSSGTLLPAVNYSRIAIAIDQR